MPGFRNARISGMCGRKASTCNTGRSKGWSEEEVTGCAGRRTPSRMHGAGRALWPTRHQQCAERRPDTVTHLGLNLLCDVKTPVETEIFERSHRTVHVLGSIRVVLFDHERVQRQERVVHPCRVPLEPVVGRLPQHAERLELRHKAATETRVRGGHQSPSEESTCG